MRDFAKVLIAYEAKGNTSATIPFRFLLMTLSGCATSRSTASFARSCSWVKMRGSNHSKDIREYIIDDDGVVVISPRKTEYYGLITGVPKRTGPRPAQKEEAAPEKKARR
jgi:hypothetical protein